MKKFVLPAVACIVMIAAIVVFLVVPTAGDQSTTAGGQGTTAGGIMKIPAADLSQDEVTFVRLADDSKVELLLRLGEDGMPKISLGTCQSCNGSPGAYYTQQGDELQCNNCKLTFPVTVVGEESMGCHPISVDPALVSVSEDSISWNVDDLRVYEELFQAVEEH